MTTLSKNNPYTKMQLAQYNDRAKQWSINNKNPVVGHFDAHNTWADYELLFTRIENQNEKIGLDFGCGPGRNIVKYKNRFKRLDGVDISPINIDKAGEYTTTNEVDTVLYVSTGIDMPLVPSNYYDFVMSTITLQHICVHEIRYSIMQDIYRVLKLGGIFTAQMGYGSPSPRTVKYYENYYSAPGTNRQCDVCVTSIDELKRDINKIGFTNFQYHITPTGPGDSHPNWIFFSAIK